MEAGVRIGRLGPVVGTFWHILTSKPCLSAHVRTYPHESYWYSFQSRSSFENLAGLAPPRPTAGPNRDECTAFGLEYM